MPQKKIDKDENVDVDELEEAMNEIKKEQDISKNLGDLKWTSELDFSELIETTNLDILPKYDKIKMGDFDTTRMITIISLPIAKEVDNEKFTGILNTMTISDNAVKYSLTVNSIATRRSMSALAIIETQKKLGRKLRKDEFDKIDHALLIGKECLLKREPFTAKGFKAEAYKFLPIK